MKKWTFFLLAAIITLVACEPQPAAEGAKGQLRLQVPEELPTDLAEMKTLLSQSKEKQRELQHLITQLETKVGELDPTQARKVSVTAIQVTQADFKHYVDIQAAVEGEDLIMASSEKGGRLLDMKWKEGDYINEGDIVARTDMEAVDKQVAELETRLQLARTVYERQKRLWDQNIGSEMQYLQAKNNMESLQKTIETAMFQKTKQYVYSPASGIVDRVMVNQGEMAGPGSPILAIMNTARVKVVAGVPEKYLSSIREGQMVKVGFPSLEEERNARVSMIGRRVHPTNRTFEVEVTLPNPKGFLKPNLQAVMMLNDETIKDAIMVPEELIRQDLSGKEYVYAVSRDGKGDGRIAKKVFIQTGEFTEGMVIVAEGLEGRELIVAKGGRGLTDGQAIEVEITEKEEGI